MPWQYFQPGLRLWVGDKKRPPILKSLYMQNPASPKKKMSLGMKILIGVGILTLIGVIGAQLDDKKETASIASGATAELTQAQKDSVKKAEEEAIKKNTITAKQLTAAYADNEVSADNNYKDKTFYVSGTITDIKKDILDNIYVTLEGNEMFRQVQCYFEDKETAGKLQKGMKATFQGKCDGLMINVLMKDCVLYKAE